MPTARVRRPHAHPPPLTFGGVLRGEGGAEVRRPHATLPSWLAEPRSDGLTPPLGGRKWKGVGHPSQGVRKHSPKAPDQALPQGAGSSTPPKRRIKHSSKQG